MATVTAKSIATKTVAAQKAAEVASKAAKGVAQAAANPTPAAVAPAQVAPYLTPSQIADYTNAYSKDEATIAGAAGQSADLLNTFDQNSAANGVKAQNSFNSTNQTDAARGFGFSGVHDNAMADIQANAVLNQTNYNRAYQTGLGTVAANVTNAQNDIPNLNLEYGGIANYNANQTAIQDGTTVAPTTYSLPTVTPPAVAAPASVAAPTTYFNNPNMGAINSAISSGASAGAAAGVPS